MKLRQLFRDVLYVSKVTGVKKKKIILFLVVIFSQATAFSDILLLVVFTAIITGQIDDNLVGEVVQIILDYKIIIPLIVILRFYVTYMQSMTMKKLELTVTKNIKVHLLQEVFDKRNYSIADAYFYLNILSGHIAFFYSNITNFLNNILQVSAYIFYLTYSNTMIFSTLAMGVLVLFFPARFLILRSREWMHKIYVYQQSSSHEIQRVVDNMFLIKLLKKENEEIKMFENTLEMLNDSNYKHIKYSSINGFLPSFTTMFIFSIILGFERFVKLITIDFIGVTLRLFQSLGAVSDSFNKIINSQVHISELYKIMVNRNIVQKNNFKYSQTKSDNAVEIKELTFRYLNSEIEIFQNLNLTIKKNSHTILTGANGSGKSTLLGLIAGVYYSQSGSVTTYLQNFGYIGATPLIFSGTLRDNILYGNEKVVSDGKIQKILKEFDTFKEEDSYDLDRKVDNKSLSSGQMQKVAFIRALLSNVEILLLDESTANLDDKSRDLIFKILYDKKITIINSTHDPNQFKGVDFHLNIDIVDEERIINFKKLDRF